MRDLGPRNKINYGRGVWYTDQINYEGGVGSSNRINWERGVKCTSWLTIREAWGVLTRLTMKDTGSSNQINSEDLGYSNQINSERGVVSLIMSEMWGLSIKLTMRECEVY